MREQAQRQKNLNLEDISARAVSEGVSEGEIEDTGRDWRGYAEGRA